MAYVFCFLQQWPPKLKGYPLQGYKRFAQVVGNKASSRRKSSRHSSSKVSMKPSTESATSTTASTSASTAAVRAKAGAAARHSTGPVGSSGWRSGTWHIGSRKLGAGTASTKTWVTAAPVDIVRFLIWKDDQGKTKHSLQLHRVAQAGQRNQRSPRRPDIFRFRRPTAPHSHRESSTDSLDSGWVVNFVASARYLTTPSIRCILQEVCSHVLPRRKIEESNPPKLYFIFEDMLAVFWGYCMGAMKSRGTSPSRTSKGGEGGGGEKGRDRLTDSLGYAYTVKRRSKIYNVINKNVDIQTIHNVYNYKERESTILLPLPDVLWHRLTNAQLRKLYPCYVKVLFSGRGQPGWGKPEKIPTRWLDGVSPWSSIDRSKGIGKKPEGKEYKDDEWQSALQIVVKSAIMETGYDPSTYFRGGHPGLLGGSGPHTTDHKVFQSGRPTSQHRRA
uniref:Nuclear respiratory factor 1 NLS/DNA-binding dimerisation domain-containing protein n=1 Tax=Branchiostoma floridae TaxID=7739 RepID=C3YB52_BRAFL|eukprot:XP_002606504.1 hypothetical protein BRAFLDRAFT_91913 [Branchiostoma floridae]